MTAAITDLSLWMFQIRSSQLEVFRRNGVLRNFAKFTGNHLRQGRFFNKVAGLRPATLLMRLSHRCFPVNFAKFLKTPFSTEHIRWLLLPIVSNQLFWKLISSVASIILMKVTLQLLSVYSNHLVQVIWEHSSSFWILKHNEFEFGKVNHVALHCLKVILP